MRSSIVTLGLAALLGCVGAPLIAQDAKPADPGAAQTVKVLPKAAADGWISLFDGSSLKNWKRTDFIRGGKVHVEEKYKGATGAIVIDAGGSLSGFNWDGAALPKTNYEIEVEAMKIDGDDFMCGLTFPVGESFASLICGGWGGYTTGISSLDSMDASENETQTSVEYKKDKWYKIRMRVTPSKLQAWLDEKKIVDVVITGKKVSMRFGEIEKSVPVGISTYKTVAAYKTIRLRKIDKLTGATAAGQ